MKPLVYTAALENGFTPATTILDQPITLQTDEGEWRPENYDREFYGSVTLRYALAKSINLVAIQVLMEVGAQTVIDYARKMGLKHEMRPVPALAIGACQATPLEMTKAYAVIARGGTTTEPFGVSKVIDRNGRVLYEHTPEPHEVIPASTAFLMADMMKDVIRRGTGARIPGLGFTRPAGGKTGTTNDYSDAWFVGFTPQIACGVWVGVDERRSLGRGVTGSDGAIPIWVPSMIALHRSLPIARFHRPEGIQVLRLCSVTNKIAGRYCPSTRLEFFLPESFTDSCEQHTVRGERRRREGLHRLFGGNNRRSSPPRDTGRSRSRLTF